jgi:hypothetical protein
MDFRTLDNDSLQKIVLFAERLVELKDGQIDFNTDLEDAEKQALDYVSRRKQGYRTLDNPEDDVIRNGVRDFLKKRSCYKPEKETRDLSITKPQI